MRMTAEQLREVEAKPGYGTASSVRTPQAAGSRAGKYQNQPVVEDGQRFDSKLEARCYRWLRLRVAAGEVRWFIRQVPFLLEGGVRYRCDFLAHLTAGGVEVIDAKGVLTESSGNKVKQMRERYGIEVQLWRG